MSWGLQRRKPVLPALMTVAAFVLAAALVALAGWFIAASAVAGLAVASTFSFLFPSGGVQALAWARTLGRYGERITTHKTTLDYSGRLRTDLFARALRLSRDRAADLRASDLLGRITADSDAIENLLLRSAFPAVASVAALAGTAVLFAMLSVPIAATAVFGMLVGSAVLLAQARRAAGRPALALVTARATARQALIETLDGLPELRSFGGQAMAAARTSVHLDHFARNRSHLSGLAAGGMSVGFLVADVTLLAVIAAAAGFFGTGSLSAPFFVAVCLVSIVAFEPILTLPGAVTGLARARAASARLAELFPSDPSPGARGRLAGPPRKIDVTLADRELELAAGDTLLVTGRSGTGKSTLLRAIAGQPSGDIDVRFDGLEASRIDPRSLVEHITLVAQDAHVFDGTIRDNLQLANPNAGEREHWAALAAADLADTAAGFPDCLDTQVGPSGTWLSGGQRRRLSVAQGLLRHAAILLLDEPTEGLDTQAAARLLSGVRHHDARAVLVIALHDRQSPLLSWSPTARLDLAPGVEARPSAIIPM